MEYDTLGPGDLILGRYEVIDVLGKGGMGVVYRCLDKVADVVVAVKCLVPGLSQDAARMVEMKGNFQLVAELRHPAIAGLRNLEQSASGKYYLVMDYVRGVDLPDYIEEHKLATADAFAILFNVAEALDYAHRAGVVHRDIKPGNIKIAKDGTIRVLDFGIAVSTKSGEARGCGGTPEYMAPEQWRGGELSGATDQYALAAMAYEIVFGQLPHAALFGEGRDFDRMSDAALHRAVTFPEGTRKKVREVFLRGLAKDPKARYSSCRRFVRALAVAMGHAKVGRWKYAWAGWSLSIAFAIALAASTWFFFGQVAWERRQNERSQAKVEHLSSEIANLEDALKNAGRLTEEEKASAVRVRDRLLAERDQLLGAQRSQDDARRKTYEGEIAALKEKLAQMEGAVEQLKTKEQERAKITTGAPITVPLGKPSRTDEELERAGVGFYYSTFPYDAQLDGLQHFSVWNDSCRTYASRAQCAYVSTPAGSSRLHCYATLMKFEPGAKYTFGNHAWNDPQIFVDGRLLFSGRWRGNVQPTVSFPEGGYHRLTIVIKEFTGSYGSPDDFGIRYRKDGGDWLPFAANDANSPFRIRVEGFDPAAIERDYAENARKLDLGFVYRLREPTYVELLAPAFELWGDKSRQTTTYPWFAMHVSLKEKETVAHGAYMLFRPGVKYEFRCSVDDHGWIYLDDRAIISGQVWRQAKIAAVPPVERETWYRLTLHIVNDAGDGGCTSPEVGFQYRENGGEWMPFTVDMDELQFRRSSEGRDPVVEEKRLRGKFTQIPPLARVKDLARLDPRFGFAFDFWIAVQDKAPGSRIFEVRYPENKPDKQFCLSFSDNDALVLQVDERRYTVNYPFRRGTDYHIAVVYEPLENGNPRVHLYVASADDLAFSGLGNGWISPLKTVQAINVGKSDYTSVPRGRMTAYGLNVWNRFLTWEQLQRLHDAGKPKLGTRADKPSEWAASGVTNHFTVVARVRPKGRIGTFPSGVGHREGGLTAEGPLLAMPGPVGSECAGVGFVVGTNGIVVVGRASNGFRYLGIAERKLPEEFTLVYVAHGKSYGKLYVNGELVQDVLGSDKGIFFDASCMHGRDKGEGKSGPFLGDVRYVRTYDRPLRQDEIPK